MVRNEDFDNLTAASADLTDTTVGTGGLTVNGGVTIDGSGDAGSEGLVLETEMDIYSQVDSSQSTGDAPNFNVTVTDSQGTRPEIHWRRRVNNSDATLDEAFSVLDQTNGTDLFEVRENGDVRIPSGVLSAQDKAKVYGNSELHGAENWVYGGDMYLRDGAEIEFGLGSDMRATVDSTSGSGDSEEFNIRASDDGGADEIHWLRNAATQQAFAVRNNTGSEVPFEVADGGDTSISGGLSVSDNTDISESAAGSTVIQNTADNPINIQLSPSGRAFLSGNTTETVIDTQDQWYEIQGAWSSAHMNFLSHTAGTLTYNGDVETQIMYDVGGAYSSPDQNANFEIAMFKDGAVKPNTPIDFSPPRAGETLSLPPIYGFTDTTTNGMSHSVRVRCTSGTTNLTIHSLSFRIKG